MVSGLLYEILEDMYQVICVAQSGEALLKLAHQRIDVILLDYGLPGGGAEEIAKRADQRGVPMIWMTGEEPSRDLGDRDDWDKTSRVCCRLGIHGWNGRCV
jgi:CheY-like chemotaxis protein